MKDITYKQKFAMLKNWMPSIVEVLKKDLKNDHLKNDWQFVKRYFTLKNINKLTTEDLAEAYNRAMAEEEKAEELGEFITSRWLIKNSELYNYFEEKLSQINPNFSEIKEIEKQTAQNMMEEAVSQFGAPKTYLFAVLNSVVFPEEIYTHLRKRAQDEASRAEEESKMEMEKMSLDAMKKTYETQLARLEDKYEKKLQGMQKKYTTDIETLKKQVATLQRKLNGQ